MATKEKEIMLVNVRKDENSASRTYGMYFGEVEYKGLLSTRALAEHIADHGSVWTRDVVEGILKQLQVCIPEKVCQGYGVELQGIGIFYPTAKGVKGGCEGPTAFNNVKEWCDGIRIRFIPESEDLRDLTRKVFKKKCALRLDNVIELTNVEDTDPVSGNTVVKRRLRNYTPLADYGLADGGDGGQGGGDDEPRP